MNKTKQPKIACIVGTRPEVIKMSPIIEALHSKKDYQVDVINTGQHRELTDEMLSLFNIQPTFYLKVMQDNQTLSMLSSNLFAKLGDLIENEKYDLILAQGDTTTTWVASQVAFYNRIIYGHVEAGLRSFDLYHPFPEELNRVLISRMATWHFVPTMNEKNFLLKEGVTEKNIYVTGNTGIDALLEIAKRDVPLPITLPKNSKMILMTLHRRESFGGPIKTIFSALIELTKKYPDLYFVFPVHPNPNVSKLAHEMLKDNSQIILMSPQRYDVFVTMMKSAYFILTDSGGLQEESPALNKPVLVLREVTERQLVIESGVGILVGNDKNYIVKAVSNLLDNEKQYNAMQKKVSPYGDGRATERIISVIDKHFHKHTSEEVM